MRTCLVLGAGATLANALFFRGQRMQSTRPPLDTTFFETVQARGIQLSPALRTYFRTLTRSDPLPERMRQVRMEDFFKDLYFDFQESPESAGMRRAYTDLVELYVRILRETTNWLCEDGRTGAPVGRLIARAADHADVITVITFNHDLVIENEIYRRARLNRRWCLDHGYGTFGGNLHPLVPDRPTVPLFPVHREAQCDHSRPISVLKLHGSLNWMVRLSGTQPTARTLSGQSGPRQVNLLPSRLVEEAADYRRRAGPGRTSWRLWPVIIPPIYAKQALRRLVHEPWNDAQEALEEADRVVFFGYSLPDIDIDGEKLFERALARNQRLGWADVINPAPASAQRYAGLAPAVPIRWYPSLAHFMASDTLSKRA